MEYVQLLSLSCNPEFVNPEFVNPMGELSAIRKLSTSDSFYQTEVPAGVRELAVPRRP